jgi:hypothetical protein
LYLYSGEEKTMDVDEETFVLMYTRKYFMKCAYTWIHNISYIRIIFHAYSGEEKTMDVDEEKVTNDDKGDDKGSCICIYE